MANDGGSAPEQAMVSVDDENPFEGLAISEAWARLGSLSERTTCSKCGKSRKYFCYTCYIPVAEIADDVPKIEVSAISFNHGLRAVAWVGRRCGRYNGNFYDEFLESLFKNININIL